MKISKKALVAIILALVVTSSIAYAAFHVEYNIPTNTVSIAGIGITVNWLGEAETVGTLVTATQFGLITPPALGFGVKPGTQNPPLTTCIVFVADCNGVNEVITWTTNLDPTVGTIALQREVYHMSDATWYWEPFASGFTMTDHAVFGFRGELIEGSKGHIRIVLQTVATALHDDYTFTITFKGDQV